MHLLIRRPRALRRGGLAASLSLVLAACSPGGAPAPPVEPAGPAPTPIEIGTTSRLEILPLVDWHAPRPELRGEVGVSYLVRTDAATILFDLGHNADEETPSPLEHNMAALGVGFDEIDTIVISHDHFDHVGGPRWEEEGSFSPGNAQPDLGDTRIYTPVPKTYPGATPLTTPEPRVIAPGVALTGALERELVVGTIAEQSLAVNVEGRGVVLIVGCSHPTTTRIVEQAEALFRAPVVGIVGGLHYPVPEGRMKLLGFVNAQRRFASGEGFFDPLEWEDVEADIAALRKRGLGLVAVGGHDSSDEVIARFAAAFGPAHRRLRVGEPIVLEAFPRAAHANPEDPMIVAHRGASFDAPENTLAAFRLAWEQGADAIEGDFHLTRDGRVVCIHDPSTGKTAARDIEVARSTLAELRALEVGAWKDERYRGEPIATLEEVLALVPAGKRILVELKAGPEIVAPTVKAIRASGLAPEQVAIIAFDERVVAASKKALPEIEAYWLTDFERRAGIGGWRPTLAQVLATLERTGADGLDCRAHASVDEAFVKGLRDAGHAFHVWTVDDPAVARRFRALGVDSITTNRPGWLREQLAAPR